MEIKYWFILLILISVYFPQTPVSANENSIAEPIFSINEEPLENSSLPFLELGENRIDLGLEVRIFFGMRNQSIFYAGYPYSLFLFGGNLSGIPNLNITEREILFSKNGTTLNTIESVTINTIKGSIILLTPNSYTFYYLINSTNRGLLNKTASFKVVAKPGANIKVDFVDEENKIIENGLLTLKINDSRKIYVKLLNIGSSPAVNISLTRIGVINEPIGLFNSSILSFIPVLPVLETINVSFSVNPSEWGIGELNVDLEYFDALGNNQAESKTFTTHVFPFITAEIIDPDGAFDFLLGSPNPLVIKVKTHYFESIQLGSSLIISVILKSDNIQFSPEAQSFKPLRTATYEFAGTPLKSGITNIDLYIDFFDSQGNDHLIGNPYYTLQITINEQGEIVPQTSIRDYFPAIALILWGILVLIILVLYFRKGLRRKFFSRVLGINFFPELKFDSHKIIVDGSNVAWENISMNGKPQIKNILHAINGLKEHGFDDITVIADAALRYQIENKDDLDELTKKGIIKVLPAKVEGDGFILRLSAQSGSLILSNDLFKEFRKEYPWIDKRRVPYSILKDKFFLHPTFENIIKN